jgi:hypothetical protein
VGTFHQQLENEHCQPKEIMLRSAIEVREEATLQFVWSILLFADRAAVYYPILGLTDLKGIGVYQRHQGSVGDQDIGLIHIADNVATGVQRPHRSGEIVGGAVQVAIVEQRTLLATGQRIVICQQRPHSGHIRHQKTYDSLLAIQCAQQINRPSNRDVPLSRHGILRRVGHHGGEFVGLRLGGRMINLRHHRPVLHYGIDTRLSPNTQGRGRIQSEALSIGVTSHLHGRFTLAKSPIRA